MSEVKREGQTEKRIATPPASSGQEVEGGAAQSGACDGGAKADADGDAGSGGVRGARGGGGDPAALAAPSLRGGATPVEAQGLDPEAEHREAWRRWCKCERAKMRDHETSVDWNGVRHARSQCTPTPTTPEPEQGEARDAFAQSFDASVWAAAFMRINKERNVAADEGTMLGWFANALMRGWDEHARRYPPTAQADTDALREAVEAVVADMTPLNIGGDVFFLRQWAASWKARLSRALSSAPAKGRT